MFSYIFNKYIVIIRIYIEHFKFIHQKNIYSRRIVKIYIFFKEIFFHHSFQECSKPEVHLGIF